MGIHAHPLNFEQMGASFYRTGSRTDLGSPPTYVTLSRASGGVWSRIAGHPRGSASLLDFFEQEVRKPDCILAATKVHVMG